MNKYLIFRTDRIGDFLISAILIKCIKINDPKSHITVIASNKNFLYIKNFLFVNNVIELQNNFINKISLIFQLRNNQYKSIIIHDNKKRSRFISLFLKSTSKIFLKNSNQFSQIKLIKIILKKLNFSFFEDSLNILSYKNEHKINNSNFIQLHFDEKWIYSSYISKFVNIEPNEDELLLFINDIIKKTNKELIITTGQILPKVLRNILPKFNKAKIKLYENLSFLELEDITLKSEILISCHGAISHLAAAKKKKQIDIIDKSYNYRRWTEHFRNYNYLYRSTFKDLSKKIIEKL